MSANLDLVRSICADWERGEFSRADWADPEIEYVVRPDPLLPDLPTAGVAGMSERWREWLTAWHEMRYEATAIRELGQERVLVLGRYSGHGKTSGLELGQLGQVASVFQLNAGKVTRLVAYSKAEDALADLGLTPDA